ncbi:MAG TPA: TetR family transcriptional regulator [Candidatus Saccharimonadales bacterium]|nr:TetR family transcriptional regulator [Candidatus Saccharimonadales bacterium]
MAYEPGLYANTRVRPQQARGKARVRAILSVALELFRVRGLDVVTTNDIAKGANIPIGSLYRYFPNKDAIISALTQMYVTDISALFREIGKNPMLPHMSWDEVLTLLLEAWIQYAQLNGPFALLYSERANPRLRELSNVHWQQFLKAFGNVLAKRCPEITEQQKLVSLQMALGTSELALNTEYQDQNPTLYYEAIGAIAAYLQKSCMLHAHHR